MEGDEREMPRRREERGVINELGLPSCPGSSLGSGWPGWASQAD